jgi:hypothetical protein
MSSSSPPPLPEKPRELSGLEIVGYIVIGIIVLIFLINLATGWPGGGG